MSQAGPFNIPLWRPAAPADPPPRAPPPGRPAPPPPPPRPPGAPVEPLRQLLARGGLLAIPTESSYGLGVDPRNPDGVEAVYRVKARGRGAPPAAAGAG